MEGTIISTWGALRSPGTANLLSYPDLPRQVFADDAVGEARITQVVF